MGLAHRLLTLPRPSNPFPDSIGGREFFNSKLNEESSDESSPINDPPIRNHRLASGYAAISQP